MAARSTWKGAIEFGGFPVYIAAYKLARSRSSDSFKSLCPCHGAPVQQPKVCSVDGTKMEAADLLKGVEVGGQMQVLDAAAVESLTGDRSQLLKIEQLVPVADLPSLTTDQFRIVPDAKVPGSEGPVNVVWNGLLANELAILTTWQPSSRSRDSILAVVADEFGLTGLQIPYLSELNETPEFLPERDDQQADMFMAFTAQSGVTPSGFAHSQFVSNYATNREAAITAALSGTPLPATAPTTTPAVPDLMAALKASIDNVQATPKKKAPARTPAPKKEKTA